MTLTELLLSCKTDLGYGTVPNLSDETGKRLTRYLNDGYRQIMRLPGFEMLRFQTVYFVTKPGLAYYIAGSGEQIYAVVDTMSQRRLTEMSRDNYRSIDPSETVSGRPWVWISDGFKLQLRPTSNYLYAVSSDVTDTTQHLTGTYLDVDNGFRKFDVVLNGQTQVILAGSPAPPPKELLSMQLSTPAAGFVTIVDNPPVPFPPPSDNWVSTIFAGDTSALQLLRLRLWPTPTDTIRYNVDVSLPLTMLKGPTDEPFLPLDFQNLLTDYAKMREYELRGDDRFQQAAALYNDGLKALKNRVTNPPDYRPVSNKYPVNPGNNLGPWFPWMGGRW